MHTIRAVRAKSEEWAVTKRGDGAKRKHKKMMHFKMSLKGSEHITTANFEGEFIPH